MNIKEINNINTKYLGRKVLYFEKIDSTQKEAKRRIMSKESVNGEIIIASNQTEGEGTHGRKWHTGEKENIAFSIVLFPNCNINKFSKLTIKIAECICECLKNLYNINIKIKEPNDLVYNNLKIGGILTQVITNKEEVKQLIIGIGINVNQINFSEELKNIATSLKIEFADINFSKVDIIKEFCEIFEKEIENLKTERK